MKSQNEMTIALLGSSEYRLQNDLKLDFVDLLDGKSHSLEPYDFIIIDLRLFRQLQNSFLNEIKNLWYSHHPRRFEIKDTYSQLIDSFTKAICEYQGTIFVLNNCVLDDADDFFLSFFQFLSKLFDINVDKFQISLATHITEDPDKIMSSHFCVIQNFEDQLNVANKITNSNKIVGFNKQNKYLIPFENISESNLVYLRKLFHKHKVSIFSKLKQDSKNFLKTHFSKPFFPSEDIKNLCDGIDSLEDKKEKLSKEFKNKIFSFKDEILSLCLQGIPLQECVINLLRKKEFEVFEIKDRGDMDFYFQFSLPNGELKYILCEVKSMKASENLDITIFRQLRDWHDSFKGKFKKDLDGNNIFLLGIVNNSIDIHPDERKLTIADNLHKKYNDKSLGKPIKIITTVNLLKFLRSDQTKQILFKKIINSTDMQIEFEKVDQDVLK